MSKVRSKKIASSATAKTAAKKLTKHGTEAVADLVADVVAGDDPSIKAKQKLDEARKDIANVIRNKGEVADHGSYSNNKKKKNY